MGSCISHEENVPHGILIPRKIIKLLKNVCLSFGSLNRQIKMDDINQRIGHVSGTFMSQFFVVWGGYRRDENHTYYLPEDFMIYNGVLEFPERIRATGEIPPCTSGATGLALEEYFYIFGGFSNNDRGDPAASCTSDIYCLNLARKKWSKIDPILKNGLDFLQADKLSSWSSKNRIFIFGGYGNPPASNIRLPKHAQFYLDEDNFVRGSTLCVFINNFYKFII